MSYIENPTVVSEAEARILQIDQLETIGLETLRGAAIESFRLLWGKPDQTAAMLAIMGTKAVAGFLKHERTIVYLLANGIQIPPEDYTPPVAYTAHEDGTVTLN